jgi:Holliday junction resolvase-like predicted endonuclease
MNRSEVGKKGEDLACAYLVNNGYQIISRNYREKFGEIDVVAKSPDKTLVFVEVKTITSPEMVGDKSPASYPHLAGLKYSPEGGVISPEDQMSALKIEKFRKISKWYANKHPELMSKNGYRLDLIAIDFNPDNSQMRHYKNV